MYDERLEALQTQMGGKMHLENVLRALQSQRQEKERTVLELHYACMDERSDVEKLEKHDIRTILYTLLGQREQRLEKERAELDAATVKYELAKAELDAIEADIREKQHALNRIEDAENEYKRLLAEKTEALSAGISPVAEEIRALRREIAELSAQQQEISEAVDEGTRALQIVELVLASLEKAGNWGVADLFDNGIISDIAKYSALDDAETHIRSLAVQLNRFRAELDDILVQSELEVRTDGLIRFTDFFFDDLFSGISVINRVSRAKNSVMEIRKKIEVILSGLKSQLRSVEENCGRKRAQLQMKVFQTKA